MQQSAGGPIDLQPILSPRIRWERDGAPLDSHPLFIASGSDSGDKYDYSPNYIFADVLFLDRTFKPESFSHINAYFLLNGISIFDLDKFARVDESERLAKREELVQSPTIPDDVVRSYDRKKLQYQNTGWNLSLADEEDAYQQIFKMSIMEKSIQQLWRTLAPGGKITFVDRADDVHMGGLFNPIALRSILGTNDYILKGDNLTEEDFEISNVLQNIRRNSPAILDEGAVIKVHLQKPIPSPSPSSPAQ